jgi:hypothetical protein
MERNPNDLDSARTGAAGSSGAAGTGAYGSSASGGATTPGTTPSGTTGIGGTAGGYGSMGSTSTADADGMRGSAGMGDESRTEQVKEKAQEGAEAAREKLSQAGERARDMKSSLEQKLADTLESGAHRLRQRGTSAASSGVGSPAYAGAGTATAGAAAGDQRMGELQQNVAKGMEKTADWLRNGDMRSTIEEQARSNPGRTLLVALGVGYLLGKTLRR